VIIKKQNDANRANDGQRGVLTVLLQDYFHRAVFRQVVGEEQWDRIDGRLEKDIDTTLELLSNNGINATFFTLGWVAERSPELINRIAREGHEIASSGFWARPISELSKTQFREDVIRSKSVLEATGASSVLGYRCAFGHIKKETSWALNILKEAGFKYDGSCCPPPFSWKSDNCVPHIHKREVNDGHIWEVPVCTSRILGMRLPISGGGYLRQFPHGFMYCRFLKWINENPYPFVLYFHPWELSDDLPLIHAIGMRSKITQYRNLGKLKEIIPKYLETIKFGSIAEYLKIPSGQLAKPNHATVAARVSESRQRNNVRGRVPVSVVVPFFNEEDSLSYLDAALTELKEAARPNYEILLVLVDDCSTDGTWDLMRSRFGRREDCMLVRHDRNFGISKAIESGIRAADTEVVCSIDADCSYDPLELLRMIPKLTAEVDLVTASPYHPKGFVLMVPPWRLFLSKSLSRLYNIVLHNKLWTYTACFRVYRKSVFMQFENRYSDFRGIVETAARLDLAGRKIIEFPTTLQSRIFGLSKMKTFKTIIGHLVLLCWTARSKLSQIFRLQAIHWPRD
jgi:polysaccharide deacetylase family protein (PEP-CTERM system associated)